MAYTNPDAAAFKAFFNRDFPYTLESDMTGVMPSDIDKALIQQQNLIPQIFPNQNVYTQASLLLAAHFLVQNLRASSQGIAGKFEWLNTNKTVGPVNASFQIPERLLENPELAILTSTYYGVQYLYVVLPLLTGQMFTVLGATVGENGGGLYSGVYGAVGPWGSNSGC